MRLIASLFGLFFCLHLFAQKNELDSASRILRYSSTPDSVKARTLRYISYLYQGTDIDSAIYYGQKAIDFSKKINNKTAIAQAYTQQASNYVWINRTEEAVHLYHLAIDIGTHIQANQVLINAYTGISYLYETTETWDKAWIYSKKALDIAELMNADKQKAYAYHEMASVYTGMNNYADAETYFIKAKTRFIQYGDLDRTATCNADMGELYLRQNKYELAKQQLDSASMLFKKLDETIQYAGVLQVYGDMHFRFNQYDSAKYYYDEAINIFSENGLRGDIANTHLSLGKMYIEQQAYDSAKQYLSSAYSFFKEQGIYEKLLNVIYLLAQADSAKGNSDSAFAYLKEYKTIAETVDQKKTDFRTRELLVEYQVEEKERQYGILRQEAALAQEKNMLATAGSIVFLLIAIAFFMLYQQKKKINRKLEISQLKTEQALEELKHVSVLKDKLFSIIAHDLRSPLANTKNLLQLTRSGIIEKEEFDDLSRELDNNLDHNRDLLDNLLNWAKSQMDGLRVESNEINLQDVVNENILLAKTAIDKKAIFIQNKIPADFKVKGDENILNLALRNTISNAIKFSRLEGDILIDCITENEKAIVIICDNGIGITEDKKQKVFSLDAVSTIGTMKEKGAGIGLRITMEMLHKMNGDIWLESIAGQGTTVYIQVDKAGA
ncbi:MAG: tetratricopeptide repeat-containing sensor histidine kinase [Ilyomonas sp.]